MIVFVHTPVPMWADEKNDGEKELVVTVVEDIPAMDIEDGPVPLAASPEASLNTAGQRHAVLMGLLLLAVIAYSLYFRTMQMEMFRLRMRAAEAEKKALSKSRGREKP